MASCSSLPRFTVISTALRRSRSSRHSQAEPPSSWSSTFKGAFRSAKVPNALLIFVRAPSLEVMETRLRARGTDDESTIRRRLDNAEGELKLSEHYDVHVVNDDLDRAVHELAEILVRNHCGGQKDHDR